MPPGRSGWLQQLGQGLAAQQPHWNQPNVQGGPPPGMQPGPQGGAMPPQSIGPEGRPVMAPGAGFARDADAAIRQALMRGRGRPPVMPEAGPQGLQQQVAQEPDADQRGGAPDGDQDDPRMQGRGMR